MESDENRFNDTVSGAENLSDIMGDLELRSQRFGAALSGALRSATVGGRGLEDVLRGLGNRLADIALSAGLKPLEGLIGNALGGIMGGLSGTVTPFAQGGVVRAPTFFPMGGGSSGGLGLMGEAGGAAPQIVFNVTATDATSFRKSEGQISAMLARSVMRGRRGL